MKTAFRLNFLALILVLASTCFAVDVSTKVAFESAYVSYGTKFAEETWTPKLDISQGDYYAGVWYYLPAQRQKSFEGEWDFFAGRTIKANKLLSFDLGATVYRYPRTDVNNTTLEGFLQVNFDTTLSPKLKLFYDVTIKNWIGEAVVAHTLTLNQTTALELGGYVGFRRPDSQKEWYYATAKADLVFTLSPKAKLSIGLRSTNNTDKAAVGHGLVNWFGTTLGYSW